MNTAFLLMAEYESAVVPLSQISQKYFGLAPQTAKFRANAGKCSVYHSLCHKAVSIANVGSVRVNEWNSTTKQQKLKALLSKKY